MEQQRLFFLFALAIVGYFLYDFWTDFQTEKLAANNAANDPVVMVPDDGASLGDGGASGPDDVTPDDMPDSEGNNSEGNSGIASIDAPDNDAQSPSQASTASNPTDGSGQGDGQDTAQRVEIETNLVRAEIDLRGGGLVTLQLKKYPVDLDDKDRLTALLSDRNLGTSSIYARIYETVYRKGAKTNWFQNFSAPKTQYDISTVADNATGDQTEAAESSASVSIPLTTTLADGVQVRRDYTFSNDEYIIQVKTQIINNGTTAWNGNIGTRLARNAYSPESDVPFVSTFSGMALNARDDDPENEYQDFDFEDIDDLGGERIKARAEGGWAAMVQHYFVAAVLPEQTADNQYQVFAKNDRYYAIAWSPAITVPAGATVEVTRQLYIGPKIQDRLDDYADNLTDTVDYGILAPLAEPMFWVMNFIHNFVGIWGLVIILITLLVKALFFKLTEAQYRSMGKMRKFAPRIKELKERYSDNRQQQQQEMMKLFKKEKINPLGGCLPILLQMPVFIALYWVLLESVELKYAAFLWLPDLTQSDPFYILPILFGLSMFVQQRMTAATATMDPMQAKIMSLLPFFLTVFFAFFPSGLVLYWVVNNLTGMLQQWYINRKLEQ